MRFKLSRYPIHTKIDRSRPGDNSDSGEQIRVFANSASGVEIGESGAELKKFGFDLTKWITFFHSEKEWAAE